MDIEMKISKFYDLDRVGGHIIGAARQAVEMLTEDLYNEVQANLHGRVLHSLSGRLASSVRRHVNSSGDVTVGTVWTEGIVYAQILEEGGVTPPHTILPKNSTVLAFAEGGGITGVIAEAASEHTGASAARSDVFGSSGDSGYAERVEHPGSHFRPYNYMQLAVDHIRDRVDPAIANAIEEAIIIEGATMDEEGA